MADIQKLEGVSPLELDQALTAVLHDYGPGSVVSTGRVSLRVRDLLPGLAIDDRELGNRVASQALSTGHSILFEERAQL